MKKFWLIAVTLACANGASAWADTLDFEQFDPLTVVTDQYAGVIFAGAQEETTAGVAAIYPYTPNSGIGFLATVASDTLSATFASAQTTISGFYTAYQGAELVAYDADGNVLSDQTLAPDFPGNAAWSVDVAGSTSIVFKAPVGTLALDDLSYSAPGASSIPEPVSFLLMGTGLFGGAGICIYRASRLAKRVGTSLGG